MQESSLRDRRQVPSGPARGFWGFEAGGGTYGVLTHDASAILARRWARHIGAPIATGASAMDQAEELKVWLQAGELLPLGFARLLIYTHPIPLPAVGDVEGSLRQYHDVWRPGKKDPERFRNNYAEALGVLEA